MGPLYASQHLAPTCFDAGKTTTGRFKAALLGSVLTGVMLLAQQATAQQAAAQQYFINADGTTTTDLNAAASSWAASPGFVANPSLVVLNAHYARAYGVTGAGVRIGLVDTSVYVAHPGFVGSNLVPLTTTGFYSLTGSFPNQVAGRPFTLSAADLSLNNLARDYHGTVMSGFIVGSGNAGYPAGVAPGATLLVARSIGQNFPTTLQGFDDGIFAASYNALVANGARAINGEWQVGRSVETWAQLGQLYAAHPTSGLLGAMQDAAEKGVLITMPNGNFSSLPGIGSALPYFRPQLENSWIAVAASNNGTTLAPSSNHCGQFTKWWCVTATSLGNANNYSPLPTRVNAQITPTVFTSRGFGGTSEASAEAVGALGVVMQRYPYLGNYEVRNILLTTATPLDKTGVSNNSGFGLINLRSAMNGPGQLLGKFNASLPGGVTDVWSNDISEAALVQRRHEEGRELAGLRATTFPAFQASAQAAAAAAPALLATLLSTIQAGDSVAALAALDAAQANPVARSLFGELVLSASFRETLATLIPDDPFNDNVASFLPNYKGPLSPRSYTDIATAMVNDYALRSSYLESKTAADYQNSFTKSGAGTLVLTGKSGYTGLTEVAGGTLVVNGSLVSTVKIDAGAALAGSGAVGSTTVAAGGVLAPGSAGARTLTINGSLAFASGAYYLVSGTSSGFSSVRVTGSAALNGNMLVTLPKSLTAIPNPTTVLTSAGLNNTRFSSVNTSFAALAGDLTYSATDVRLTFSSGFGRIAGLNANQTAVGSAIDNALNGGGATLPASFAGLMTSGTAQSLPATLSALSGESHASTAITITQGMNAFLTTILDPSIESRSTGLGAALGYAPPSQAKRNPSAFAQFGMAPKVAAATDPSRFAVWGSSYGAQGTVNGNAATGSRTTTSRIYGTAAGLDYRLTPDTVVGFSLGGGTASWGLAENAGNGSSDLFQAGLYGKTHKGPTYLSAALAYGWNGVTSSRNVSALGNDRLEETFNANNIAARVEGGWRIAMPVAKLPGLAFADAGLTPYAAVQTQAINLGGSHERAVAGSPQFALNYGSQSLSPTRTELGTRYDSLFRLGASTDLLLRARLAWAHDFNNDNRARALFQTLPTAVFTTNGASPAADGALISAGAEMRFANGMALAAKFDGEFSSTTTIYAGTVTARYQW